MQRARWLTLIDALALTPLAGPTAGTPYVGERGGRSVTLRWHPKAVRLIVGAPEAGHLHLSARGDGRDGRATGDADFDAAVRVGPTGDLVRLHGAARPLIQAFVARGVRLTETGAWWRLDEPAAVTVADIDALLALLDALGPPDGPTLVQRAATQPSAVAAAAAARLDAQLRAFGDAPRMSAALIRHRPAGWDRWLSCLAPFADQADALRRCPTALARAAHAAFFGDIEREDTADRLVMTLFAGDPAALPACWRPVFEERLPVLLAALRLAPPRWQAWLGRLTLDAAGHAARLSRQATWAGVAAADLLLAALTDEAAIVVDAARQALAGLVSTAPEPMPRKLLARVGWHAEILRRVDPLRITPVRLLAIEPRTDAARVAWARLAAAAPRVTFEARLLGMLGQPNRRVVESALTALSSCATDASRPFLAPLDHPMARALLARLTPHGRLSEPAASTGHLAPVKKTRNLP